MCIESVSLVESFDKWVSTLPPERRSKAYYFVGSFLHAGAWGGLASELNTLAYLSRKEKESKV
ncbi:hypothetical protein KKA24_03510 [Patescibacteria group bacterium]|nr:hypothetical protein [Patescibacteria group bacterium]